MSDFEVHPSGFSGLPATPVQKPINMVLHCPACGLQHIDRDETPSDREWSAQSAGDREQQYWANPPHRSHKCHGCGHIWRPADLPTNGVAAVQSKGRSDSPIRTRGLGRLTKPARVGSGTFGVGVQAHLVVEAAQRLYEVTLGEADRTPEQRRIDEMNRRQVWDMMNGDKPANEFHPVEPGDEWRPARQIDASGLRHW